MSTINPGIHNLSDAELEGRRVNILGKLSEEAHVAPPLASCPAICRRCKLLRSLDITHTELRRREARA